MKWIKYVEKITQLETNGWNERSIYRWETAAPIGQKEKAQLVRAVLYVVNVKRY